MAGSKTSRALALAEVLGVYVVGVTVHYLTPDGWVRAQQRLCGYPFLSDVQFEFLPVALVWLLTRRPAAMLGLSLQGWRGHLWTGLMVGGIFSTCFGPAHGVLPLLGTCERDWLGGAVLTAFTLLAIPATLLLLRRRPGILSQGAAPRPAVLVAFVPVAAIAGIALARVSWMAAAVLFMVAFVCLGEELLFRGYFQSRLNEAFGRPFSWCGVRWGWGLVITAALFGLIHPLGLPQPAWALALPTTVAGFVFGLVREKTGSIYAAAACHAVGNVISLLLGRL